MSEECVYDMKFKRFLCFVSVLFILISSCSGCGKGEKISVAKKFKADIPAESISAQTVASNNSFKLDWNDEIKDKDDLVIVDKNWVEAKEVKEPDVWNPAEQLIKYLETLFEASEKVGYVTYSYEKDGKFLPSKGNWDRAAGQLIQQLSKNKDDIGAVIGDYNATGAQEEKIGGLPWDPVDN